MIGGGLALGLDAIGSPPWKTIIVIGLGAAVAAAAR